MLEDDIFLIKEDVKEPTLSKALFACDELHGEYVYVFVNDVGIHFEDWHIYEFQESDIIIAVPGIAGFSWSGGLIGAVVGAIVGFVWTGTWYGAVVGAIRGFYLGSMVDALVNPPSVPELPVLAAISSSGSDPNYSWAGSRLVTQPDGPVSILYGEYLIGGALIMQYISSDGTNNFLHMLIALSEGEIEGIVKEDESGVCTSTSDTPYILINGQAFSNYKNTTWDYRLGTFDQTVIDGFHRTSLSYADGRKVAFGYGNPTTYTTTGTDVEEITVQLSCPSLYQQTSTGDIKELKVHYLIHFRIYGVGAPWSFSVAASITAKSKTRVYSFSTRSNLAPNKYEIKITRTSPEYTGFKKSGDLYLDSVTETVYENIAYRNTALLSLKIQASDQLSGSIPNVLTLTRGRKILVPKLTVSAATQTYDDCYWNNGAGQYRVIAGDAICTDTGTWVRQYSKHPIWCTRDFMLNSRFGLGEYIDTFDDIVARTEAKHAWELVDDLDSGTEHRFELDLPISRFTSGPEATQLIAGNYRGSVFWSGGNYKAIIDRSRTAVQPFNMSNINPRSLKTTYLPNSKISNLIELQYADPERNYNITTVEAADWDQWTTAKPIRKKTTKIPGATRVSQVLRDGKFFLNCELNCTKMVEFTADMDAIHVEPGDVFRLQSDSLAWGGGGRVVSATSNSVTTNIDVTYVASDEIRIRLSDGSLETKTINSVTNNNRTINIAGNFTSVPLVDSIFTYGAASVDSKPFKTLAITKASDQTVSIVGLEESSSKYADTTGISLPDPRYSTLPNPAEAPGNVTDLSLTEMNRAPGFYISFNIPQNDISFHHADIHLSLDNSHYWPFRANITTNADIEITELKPGQTYYIRVISYNSLGIANTSPVSDSILISWNSFRPPDVNGLRLDGESRLGTTEFTNRDAKFTWVKTSLVSGAGHLPAGQEGLGVDQWFDDANYKFIVEIYIDGTVVRKEVVTDNAYVYTYEKNLIDNVTAANSFTFRVWGFNELANLKSLNPAKLRVTNPAPESPQNLSGIGFVGGTRFVWDNAGEVDFIYWTYRIKVTAGGSWSEWAQVITNRYSYELSQAEKDAYSLGATVYFELRSHDTFENNSGTSSTNAIAYSLTAADFDTTPPAVPTGLSLRSRVEEDADGHQSVILTASWDPNTESDFARYGWARRASQERLFNYGYADDNRIEFDVKGNWEYFIKIRAEDSLSNRSAYASVVSLTSSLDTDTPAAPAGLTAADGFGGVQLSWNENSENDIKHYNVYRHTASDSSLATIINNAKLTRYRDRAPAYNTDYYYWLKAEDTSGNFSPFSENSKGQVIHIDTADLKDELITTAKVLASAITANKIALETITGSRIAGGAIASTHITASAITTPKLAANSVIAVNINAGAVTSNKILAEAVIAGKLSANAVLASNITALSVTGAKITGLAIAAGHLNANSVLASHIIADAIDSTKIVANTITATEITTGQFVTASANIANAIIGDAHITDLNADKLHAGTITATQIKTNTITASLIGSKVIVAANILGNTITADEIAANTITADQIAAETITASQIAVQTLTASQIKGSGFGTLEITSGKIIINTTDALEIRGSGNIKVVDGGDIQLIGAADPGFIKFIGTSYESEMYTEITGAVLRIQPTSNNNVYCYIGGTSNNFKTIFLYTANTVQSITPSYSTILDEASASFYCVANKALDLGRPAFAWDDFYYDDLHNVADYYFMDERKDKDGNIVPVDDLAVINGITSIEKYHERTGLKLINDSSLPAWIVSKYKRDGEDRDEETGDIIKTWKRGDTMYSPDGKPYLSLKTMMSLCMGAIRQLDNKLEKNCKGINYNSSLH